MAIDNFNDKQQPGHEEGDYYRTIYKGPLLTPVLGVLLVVGLWLFLRKRSQS